MKNATFYLLNDDYTQDNQSIIEKLACDVVAERWRSGNRVLIVCENQQQAIRLDEELWTRPTESFIPHNLMGKGLKNGSPVEITWSQKHSSTTHDVFVNLCINFIDFSTTMKEVIDFVPCEKSLKQLARKRYKAYRKAGFNLNTVILE